VINPRTIAFVLAAAAALPAAAADDLYTRYFAVDGGQVCYLRVYDAAHLKAHPRQTVRRIFVDFAVARRSDESRKNGADDFEAGIEFMLRRSPEWYGQALSCKTVRDHFECYLEADGGTFTLTPRGDALRLEVTGGRGSDIHTEGEKDFGTFGAPGSDDRVFILRRADPKTCEAVLPH
jgi:hypothetical protein